MGKDLKGRELGVGISQRKSDGLYSARFKSKRNGKVIQRYFGKLQECRNWYAEATYQDEFSSINANDDMTLSAWFDYWIVNIKGETVRYNTRKNYTERFNMSIRPVIGNMKLNQIKPIHCQEVLNGMRDKYKISTICQVRITLYTMLADAVENNVIIKNPVTKAVKYNIGRESKKPRFLTIQEQAAFLEAARDLANYNQYAFLLQTGLRAGELIGLKWSDIDLRNKVLHIRRSMEYRYNVGEWRVGEPKSKSGYRDIPLTDEAIRILSNQRKKVDSLKVIDINYRDYVFLGRKGEPIKNSTYNTCLFHICDKVGIARFSMHVLRHTFATRCIEAGMRPKTLQIILGHSNIGITMNLYVHVTEEEKCKEMNKISEALLVV